MKFALTILLSLPLLLASGCGAEIQYSAGRLSISGHFKPDGTMPDISVNTTAATPPNHTR